MKFRKKIFTTLTIVNDTLHTIEEGEKTCAIPQKMPVRDDY